MVFLSFHLSLSGHYTASTIMNLNEYGVMEIEQYSRDQLPSILRSTIDPNCRNLDEVLQQLIDIIFGNYSRDGKTFKFPPGHKMLLLTIANAVRNTVCKETVNGKESYDFTEYKTVKGSGMCSVIATPIGDLFCDDEDDSEVLKDVEDEESSVANKRSKPGFVEKHTDNTIAKVPLKADSNSLKQLVQYLSGSLLFRLKSQVQQMMSQDKYEASWNDLKAEVIEVEFHSVVSTLKNFGVILEGNQQTYMRKSIFAAINCVCSETTKIKVHFKFKESTRGVIENILSHYLAKKSTEQLDEIYINAHFASCWCMSNFYNHRRKLHKKREMLKDGKYFLP